MILQRPPSVKPRDPSTYQFNDEQLEQDYRKMYEKYQEMEALLKEHPEMDAASNNYGKEMSETIAKDSKKGVEWVEIKNKPSDVVCVIVYLYALNMWFIMNLIPTLKLK